MGGASLETHIGRNAKDILKTNKSSRSARLNNDASRRGASTAVRLFGFGSGDAPRKSKDNDVRSPAAIKLQTQSGIAIIIIIETRTGG
jgi:hypothetical protein